MLPGCLAQYTDSQCSTNPVNIDADYCNTAQGSDILTELYVKNPGQNPPPGSCGMIYGFKQYDCRIVCMSLGFTSGTCSTSTAYCFNDIRHPGLCTCS